ncbi:MAG: hypothetical protein WDZ75_00470 [Candidatus Paceibacterota bacterium]
MMYLKPKQHYIDRYDELTVEKCRRLEKTHQEGLKKDPPKVKGKKIPKKAAAHVRDYAHHFMMFFEKGEAYVNKEKTIQKWMERDRALDELLDSAKPPEDIRCLTCRSLTKVTNKHIHSEGIDEKDRVLFMFECPNGCLPYRAFFNDGEEWKSKPILCPKCKSDMDHDVQRKGNTITTIDTCTNCKYVAKDSFTLSSEEEKKVDKNYAKDRDRFCLSDKEGQEYIETRRQMESMKEFMDEWKEKQKHQKDYDAVDKLKKLTIVELENLLTPLCEKAGYVKLTFDAPDMGKDLIVSFRVSDSKSDRQDRASTHDLQKIIKKTLADTNWRLMSDGCSYRLGIVTGRLRAYEREEDLLDLIRGKRGK